MLKGLVININLPGICFVEKKAKKEQVSNAVLASLSMFLGANFPFVNGRCHFHQS